MTDKYDAKATELLNPFIWNRGTEEVIQGSLEHQILPAISSALRSAAAEEREAWMPLYALAVDYQIVHEGIMAAWEDKASPDAKATLERLRGDLFDACRHAREKTGLSAEAIATAIRSRGDRNLVQSTSVPDEAQCDHLMKENAALKALKPFAAVADFQPGRRNDEIFFARYGEKTVVKITWGDLRRARDVLRSTASGDSTGSQDDQRLIETNNGRQP